jgi:hypothetical protein
MLTALTASLAFVVTLIILVPVWPSRENVISMPTLRRNVCARRCRPASARGFFTHAGPPEMSSRALSAHNRNRSDALPVQVVRSIMIARTQVAIGSASMMLSMAALRLDRISTRKSAGRPKSGFTRRSPEREIGHAGQPVELNATHGT